ncbi:MAG TPA: cytochrome c [Candidatus Limnocylindria bacterium]|nr:cytochrome c [Candidatus Limnocylindria bacterium]
MREVPVQARPLAPMASLLAFATIVHALLVGCGGGAKQSTTTENGGTPPPVTSVGDTSAPMAGGGDLGAAVYTKRCVLCHGSEGKGDGPGAAGLNPKPRNHTDGAYMNARTDADLLNVIRNGKGSMPPWGKILSEAEIQAVLAHVRTLAK